VRRQPNKPTPVLTGFVNNISGDYFEAYLMGTEDIEGKPFYILKMKDHPRIVKMAVSALKKSKTTVDLKQRA
jgi:hypothetical protein